MYKIILLGIIIFNNPAFASEKFCKTKKPHSIDIWYEKEMSKTGSVTANIRDVQSDAYKKWDTELNRIYKELSKKLKKQDNILLRQTQNNWIKFRDSEIKYWWSSAMYGASTGNMQTMIISTKSRNMVRKRVCDLIQYDSLAYNF